MNEIITANPDACIGAFYHKPAYSTVPRGASYAKALCKVLADSGVLFVLYGHNHFYEHTKPTDGNGRPAKGGTMNFISGAGGNTETDRIEPAAFADQLITNAPGVLKLDFSSDEVTWTYVNGEKETKADAGKFAYEKAL